MIDREHTLPVARQAKRLRISLSSVYYLPQPVSSTDLILTRRLDELHLEYPFTWSRMLRDLLRRDGHQASRKRVRSLLPRIGIEALYRKPNTSKQAKGYTIHPYFLREVKIDRPSQVRATDITHIPMDKGFVYLCAIVVRASRKVLSHRASISMKTDFCLEALHEAFEHYGKPKIFKIACSPSSRLLEHLKKKRHSNQHGWQRLLAR